MEEATSRPADPDAGEIGGGGLLSAGVRRKVVGPLHHFSVEGCCSVVTSCRLVEIMCLLL